jgi:hypothetical protein
MSKPLAKSLHTVTVLVAIARSTAWVNEVVKDRRFYQDQRAPMPDDLRKTHDVEIRHAVDYALRVLGVKESPDTYGLREQAISRLTKGA